MEFGKGMIVISRAGHDKGSFLAVVGTEDGRVLVADGKERPIAKPKRKNPKHLAMTRKTVDIGGMTDKALRKALREASGTVGGDDEDPERSGIGE